jgi:hypothetical protein
LYKANEVGDVLKDNDDFDIKATHEASKAGDAADALSSLYKASKVEEVEVEDRLL